MILKQKNGKRWKKQYPVIINSENSYAIYLIKVIVTPTETLYLCSIRINSPILINKLLFYSLQLRSNACIQSIIINIEDESALDRRIYHSLQFHLRMQDMRCCGADTVFRLLVHRNSRNQFAYPDML